jgi:hypothetical protein
VVPLRRIALIIQYFLIQASTEQYGGKRISSAVLSTTQPPLRGRKRRKHPVGCGLCIQRETAKQGRSAPGRLPAEIAIARDPDCDQSARVCSLFGLRAHLHLGRNACRRDGKRSACRFRRSKGRPWRDRRREGDGDVPFTPTNGPLKIQRKNSGSGNKSSLRSLRNWVRSAKNLI